MTWWRNNQSAKVLARCAGSSGAARFLFNPFSSTLLLLRQVFNYSFTVVEGKALALLMNREQSRAQVLGQIRRARWMRMYGSQAVRMGCVNVVGACLCVLLGLKPRAARC